MYMYVYVSVGVLDFGITHAFMYKYVHKLINIWRVNVSTRLQTQAYAPYICRMCTNTHIFYGWKFVCRVDFARALLNHHCQPCRVVAVLPLDKVGRSFLPKLNSVISAKRILPITQRTTNIQAYIYMYVRVYKNINRCVYMRLTS